MTSHVEASWSVTNDSTLLKSMGLTIRGFAKPSRRCLDHTLFGVPQSPKTSNPSDPHLTPEEDERYEWGIEEADFVSLAPIFNPENTSWPGKNETWGHFGFHTPRRASVGMHSRCSKKLLGVMHAENIKGNNLDSEMAPQTVALLHGLKAVYASMPVFFDRDWKAESLQKYFTPGSKVRAGVSETAPSVRTFKAGSMVPPGILK
jgi:hypothetical protein